MQTPRCFTASPKTVPRRVNCASQSAAVHANEPFVDQVRLSRHQNEFLEVQTRLGRHKNEGLELQTRRRTSANASKDEVVSTARGPTYPSTQRNICPPIGLDTPQRREPCIHHRPADNSKTSATSPSPETASGCPGSDDNCTAGFPYLLTTRLPRCHLQTHARQGRNACHQKATHLAVQTRLGRHKNEGLELQTRRRTSANASKDEVDASNGTRTSASRGARQTRAGRRGAARRGRAARAAHVHKLVKASSTKRMYGLQKSRPRPCRRRGTCTKSSVLVDPFAHNANV